MYSTIEYTYYEDNKHLTDDDALEVYKKAKTTYPNGLVVLDDLDCGHWDVHVYNTDIQKQAFYRKRLADLYKNIITKFVK